MCLWLIISPLTDLLCSYASFFGHKKMYDNFFTIGIYISCRSGSSSGLGGINKLDGSSQPGSSARSMPRNDVENVTLLNDKRDRGAGLEKERVMAKGSNKYVYKYGHNFFSHIFIGICVELVTKSRSLTTSGKLLVRLNFINYLHIIHSAN